MPELRYDLVDESSFVGYDIIATSPDGEEFKIVEYRVSNMNAPGTFELEQQAQAQLEQFENPPEGVTFVFPWEEGAS